MTVGVLYQVNLPPLIDGIPKPMKPEGYADSGADIAFALNNANIKIVTPVVEPNSKIQTQWVFADTEEGICIALSKGANVLWLNTVLYSSHPIEKYLNQGGWVIGQDPVCVEKYDDKWQTNQLLKSHGLPIPHEYIINRSDKFQVQTIRDHFNQNFSFPFVVKPIRGRGSIGVTMVHNEQELNRILSFKLPSSEFGDAVILEHYLPGQELTITVMPPGNYSFKSKDQYYSDYWCLPPVKRFSHKNGVAPYNGTVAVIKNSQVLTDEEIEDSVIENLMFQCTKAAKLVEARAPIRIDCRQDVNGDYFLFDLNMKPNMTGSGRPGRENQESLSALAAKKIGWSYTELLLNILQQAWKR
ncbi:ATP-grasp domain-containing protein [Spirosoma sp. BT702]|uniref:ATP-grasp domain-containing protein n=2 Tax=Spirosoma profusum TaxID=2771354 RepID=A0A926XTU2_9BACT|nr:ATP-grasp domain-containing protein [Spirosoma profusum]